MTKIVPLSELTKHGHSNLLTGYENITSPLKEHAKLSHEAKIVTFAVERVLKLCSEYKAINISFEVRPLILDAEARAGVSLTYMLKPGTPKPKRKS